MIHELFYAVGGIVVIAAGGWAVVWVISTIEQWLFPKSPPRDGPHDTLGV